MLAVGTCDANTSLVGTDLTHEATCWQTATETPSQAAAWQEPILHRGLIVKDNPTHGRWSLVSADKAHPCMD